MKFTTKYMGDAQYDVHYENEDVFNLAGAELNNYVLVPYSFYEATKRENGKSYRLAAELLGYVFTWYRGSVKQIGKNKYEVEQSFKGEVLYVNYAKLSNIFCASVQELSRAFAHLKKLKLVEIKYKPIHTGSLSWIVIHPENVIEALHSLITGDDSEQENTNEDKTAGLITGDDP